MKKKSLLPSLIGLAASASSFAQSPVTAITSQYVQNPTGENKSYSISSISTDPNSCGENTGDYFFGSTYFTGTDATNNNLELTDFTAGGKKYMVSEAAPTTVKLRRVNNPQVNDERHILFFMDNTADNSATSGQPPYYLRNGYADNMESAFSGRILNRGSDNILGNINEGNCNYNNIERVDIFFSQNQLTYANGGNGVVIFERGRMPGYHGRIKVALILSKDANNTPTAYSNVISITNGPISSGGSWGETDVTQPTAFTVLRKNNSAEDMKKTYATLDASEAQRLGGLFIAFSDFGLATGTPVVGYSFMAGDFTGSTAVDILDINNPAIYPLNTDAADNGVGGMDLITVTGAFYDPTAPAPLPVSFGTVDASIANNNLTVNFTTEKEANNSHFNIEASLDGTNFKSIGLIDSKAKDGNSDIVISYQYNTSASDFMGIGGVAGAAVLLVLALTLVSRKNKSLRVPTYIIAAISLVGSVVACSKSGKDVNPKESKKVWVRVVQIDKDGTKSYSKVVIASHQ